MLTLKYNSPPLSVRITQSSLLITAGGRSDGFIGDEAPIRRSLLTGRSQLPQHQRKKKLSSLPKIDKTQYSPESLLVKVETRLDFSWKFFSSSSVCQKFIIEIGYGNKKKLRDAGELVMMLANCSSLPNEIILIPPEFHPFEIQYNRFFCVLLSGHVLLVIYISDSSPIDDVSCCLVSVYEVFFFYHSVVVGLLVLFLLTNFVMDHWMHECGNIIGNERSSLATSGGSRTLSSSCCPLFGSFLYGSLDFESRTFFFVAVL